MTFFYNLNDKLNAIREKPETTHKQLNERDMSRAAKGYEKYGKEGMQALAKAGREGKALDPVRAKYDKYDDKSVDESQLNELSPELLKRARDKAGMKYAQADDRRDQKASDKYNRQDDKFNSALRKKQKDMDEGMGDVVKKVGGAVKKVGGAVLNKLGHGSDEDMRKDLQRKMGMPQTGKKPQELDELSSELLNRTRNAASRRSVKFDNEVDRIKSKLVKQRDDPEMALIPGYNKASQHYANLSNKASVHKANMGDKMHAQKLASQMPAKMRNAAMAEEDGAPMTPKQKSFAKLAPPKDKITFADKIAGAKKEVDEMLGDVAAEAIKSALSPKQKKIDMNKNGKLDANDFAMLRKGGKKETDEGFPTVDSARDEMRKRKVGDVTHGDKHDTQEIPGGRRVTRRTDPNTGYSVGADSDETAAGEKRGRGRPKGADKGPERVTSKATKHKGGRKTNENDLDITDRGEYDQEGDMAKDSIKTVVRHAQALEKILGDNDNLPEWVQSKLAKIESMMTAVDDYMQNQEDDEMAMGEEKTSTRDNRAERAGRKVAKDIEYDEKKKDGIHGKKRGSEDDRAEKAGKKVAKDIEYDEKKDKPKKVKEQGGTDTPTASSGFSYGQGIYDSMNRELESMISESMNISMSMNTDANGGPSRSVTVTATDDDAMKLGELLKNAGLGGDYAMGGQAPGAEVEVHGAEDIADKIRQAVDGDHGHEHDGGEVCDACGQEDCGCEPVDEAYGDDVVDQNSPDYPTNTETAQDSFEYSGGLNGPKSTGQSTVPVLASQEDRQHTYENDQELRRMMEMAGVKKKEVDEEKTEEGNLFTKGLADDDVKVGEKIPGTDAVKKKDIDEGILASTASLWKQYKGQYGV